MHAVHEFLAREQRWESAEEKVLPRRVVIKGEKACGEPKAMDGPGVMLTEKKKSRK